MTNCLAIAPLFFVILAFLFSLVGSLWCQMVSIPANQDFRFNNGTRPDDLINTLPDFQYGLWFRRDIEFQGVIADTNWGLHAIYSNVCVGFTNPGSTYKQMDGLWWASVVMQGIAWLSALIMMVWLSCASCMPPKRLIGQGIFLLIPLTVCQGLVFLVFASNFCYDNPDLYQRFRPWRPDPIAQPQGVCRHIYGCKCNLGPGGIMLVAATVMYFVAGLLCFCLGGNRGSSGKAEPEVHDAQVTPVGAAGGAGAAAVATTASVKEEGLQAALSSDDDDGLAIKASTSSGVGVSFVNQDNQLEENTFLEAETGLEVSTRA